MNHKTQKKDKNKNLLPLSHAYSLGSHASSQNQQQQNSSNGMVLRLFVEVEGGV